MAKVLATEIRVGNLIELDKRVWRVLKSYHVHVGGRGGAFMQVEMKDVNWIIAPTEIGKLGRWDKHVNYHQPNTVWCVSFRSLLPRTKPITFDEVWGLNISVLLRSHGNTICDLDHSIYLYSQFS